MFANSKYNEQDNDWAFDIKEEPIHISQAVSGAKGYNCMGCRNPMQAVKMKNPKHQSYFRHHVKDVDHSKNECVQSSREYREKLAYFYFMRVKQIKVPAVYKFPPKGEEGNPNLLQEAKTIIAHRIERELTFYENEDGEIKWGKNPEIDERFLLIRPDAVFFDENDKPILFLEFVITHKPDIDKLNKLQRLGIDTVQIIVPKLPEVELEKSISSVSNVKWTYNEIESNTEYIRISSGSSEGVLSIDEEQRKLFEESYKCRAAQVSNLIRSIKRCVESQSYKRVERHFEQEISRIERATREHRSRLDEIQKGVEGEIYSELGERRSGFERSSSEFQKNYSDLEGRYIKKRSSIIEEQRTIEWDIEFRNKSGRTEEGVRSEFGRIEEDTRREFEREERFIDDDESDVEFELEEIRKQQERIDSDNAENTTFERDFTGKEESLSREFEQFEAEEQENFERKRESIESEIKGYREIQNTEESGIRSEFEGKYQQIIERFNNRDVQSGDELSERLKTILELRGLFDSYSNGEITLEKYRKGNKYLKEGTWKKWN